MNQTRAASSAEISVDGNVLKSDTNTFDDSIQDLKVTVLRVSDKDSVGISRQTRLISRPTRALSRSLSSSSWMVTTPCKTR